MSARYSPCRSRLSSSCPAAFTIIELLVVIAIIALLVAILLPALKEARRAGRQAVCTAQLQQLGRAHHEYATDFKDFIATFNGRGEDRAGATGIHQASWPTLAYIGYQARDILYRVLPDQDHPEYAPTTGDAITVLPVQHSYLVMLPYLGDRLPTAGTACTEDRARLEWQKNPHALIESKGVGLAEHNKVNVGWLPYSSSYELLPAGWLRDPPRPSVNFGESQPPVTHGGFHDRYRYVNKSEGVGGNKITDVFAPACKVALADSQQRHFGKDLYMGYEQTRQPLLFWDSSVSVRYTRDANPGWDRGNHRKDTPASYEYKPDPVFESPAIPAGRSNGPVVSRSLVTGSYRWTRGGLKGIDFGGKEIKTSTW